MPVRSMQIHEDDLRATRGPSDLFHIPPIYYLMVSGEEHSGPRFHDAAEQFLFLNFHTAPSPLPAALHPEFLHRGRVTTRQHCFVISLRGAD